MDYPANMLVREVKTCAHPDLIVDHINRVIAGIMQADWQVTIGQFFLKIKEISFTHQRHEAGPRADYLA